MTKKYENGCDMMEILSQGKDIYDRINYCNTCGCVFKTNREDATVFYEDNICKHFVECPSCNSLILIGFSKQAVLMKTKEKDKEERKNEI